MTRSSAPFPRNPAAASTRFSFVVSQFLDALYHRKTLNEYLNIIINKTSWDFMIRVHLLTLNGPLCLQNDANLYIEHANPCFLRRCGTVWKTWKFSKVTSGYQKCMIDSLGITLLLHLIRCDSLIEVTKYFIKILYRSLVTVHYDIVVLLIGTIIPYAMLPYMLIPSLLKKTIRERAKNWIGPSQNHFLHPFPSL